MIAPRSLLFMITVFALTATGRAQTPIFADDFESDRLGSIARNPAWNNNADQPVKPANVVADTSNVFGFGGDNRMLQFTTNSQEEGLEAEAEQAGAINFGVSGVVSLTFSLYLPKATNSHMFVALVDDAYTTVAGVPILSGVVGGQGSSIAGSPAQITLVANTSGSTHKYSGKLSKFSIANHNFDVWVNGNRIIQGWGTPPAAIAGFALAWYNESGGPYTAAVDNVSVTNGATVGALPQHYP